MSCLFALLGSGLQLWQEFGKEYRVCKGGKEASKGAALGKALSLGEVAGVSLMIKIVALVGLAVEEIKYG